MNVSNTARVKDPETLEALRDKLNDLGKFIEENVPAGRYRNIALTNLETASMYAVKAAVGDD